jgi:predicted AAA+ superfamily ATPase
MIIRQLTGELLRLAKEYPVVTILGPRQSGKTTLARSVFAGYRYVNCEDPEVRRLAESDPRAFFRQNPTPLIIDEVQRVPALCSWIQVLVDESGKNGEFVLTGSAQLDLGSTISQSLAGRNALTRLYPLSLKEMREAGIPLERDQCLVNGFFPRIHAEGQEPVRAYRNYIQTYLERDLRSLLNIRNLQAFERFLSLLAGRIGQLVNLHSLANDTGVSSTTLNEWLGILEGSFVIYRLKPFFENIGKRLVKAPKLYFCDPGLAASLLGIQSSDAAARDPLMGSLFENMIVMEAVKQIGSQGLEPSLYFYRDQNGREIDLILERDRKLIPIEIKSSQTWNPDFARQIPWFRQLTPRAEAGLVVYGGDSSIDSDGYSVRSFRDVDFSGGKP